MRRREPSQLYQFIQVDYICAWFSFKIALAEGVIAYRLKFNTGSFLYPLISCDCQTINISSRLCSDKIFPARLFDLVLLPASFMRVLPASSMMVIYISNSKSDLEKKTTKAWILSADLCKAQWFHYNSYGLDSLVHEIAWIIMYRGNRCVVLHSLQVCVQNEFIAQGPAIFQQSPRL